MLNIFNIIVIHAMKLEQIGHEIRRSRLSQGLTQAQLADSAHITRTTLNQLENGVIKDLGIRKVEALLDQLGLALLIDRTPEPNRRTFCASPARQPA